MRLALVAVLACIACAFIHQNRPRKSYERKLLNKLGEHRVSRLCLAASSDPSPIPEEETEFDFDFAAEMSRPLPEWYEEEKVRKENYLKEITDNRERIIQEFRDKYEITEDEKIRNRDARWEEVQKRKTSLIEKKRDSLKKGPLRKAISTSIEGDEEEETTKEKWEKFWIEEEESTGFNLPGFFEVFPELKLMWPTWARRRDGSAVTCVVDSDCPFPQACCPHPIIPGDKFCCTGWTQRVMVPAYALQQAKTNTLTRDEQKEQDENGGNGNLPAPGGSGDSGGYGLPEN